MDRSADRPAGRPAALIADATPVEGPIAIVGGSGHVGTALKRRLAGVSNEVRAPSRGDDLGASLRDAAAVVHLAGTLRPHPPTTSEEANLGTVERTVAALRSSSVERVIFLSYVGADAGSKNAYVRAKAEAERLLHNTGRDCVVFRCTHIFGPPDEPGPLVSALLARNGRAWILGNGSQRLAPVYRGDVVDAIVAALDPRTYHGRFDLPGPDEMTMDEFVAVVNRGPVKLRHVPSPIARALSHAVARLTPELVDALLADSLGEQGRADRAFGLERRSVRDLYASAVPVAA